MPKLDLLDPDKITENLKTACIGKKVLVFKNTSSTNDIAAEYTRNKKNHGVAIFAEEQTTGRGRAGNIWLSHPSQSLLCSIVLTETALANEMLSLTSAVAVTEAIGNKAKIKWPNDILINKKKVAGILVESKQYRARKAFVIGIGINCHQTKEAFPPELQTIATSIDIQTKSTTDRISLARRLLVSIDHWLTIADKTPSEIISRWENLSIQLGHRVTVICNKKKYTGTCIGIDPVKGLIIRLETGGIRIFNAAHTSIEK